MKKSSLPGVVCKINPVAAVCMNLFTIPVGRTVFLKEVFDELEELL